eukprot:m.33111 g.33111  ORF g.33111 m.33111 type:complete len:54 (-) comp9580_c0_seq1:42-203(-)
MALRERLESVTLRASRRWQPEDLKEAVARINARYVFSNSIIWQCLTCVSQKRA